MKQVGELECGTVYMSNKTLENRQTSCEESTHDVLSVVVRLLPEGIFCDWERMVCFFEVWNLL